MSTKEIQEIIDRLDRLERMLQEGQAETWLSIKDVAQRLGVSYAALATQRSKGTSTIPFSKRDGKVGICESVFNAWLRGESQAA